MSATEIVADTDELDITSGTALCIDDVPVDKVDGPDEASEADTLSLVPPRLVDPEVGKTKTLLVMAVLAV